MVGPQAKKEAAEFLQQAYNVSERRACRALELPRSTKRHQPRADRLNERIISRLRELSEKKKRYGSPRLHQFLLREGFKINHKRTERFYRKEGLSLRRKKKRRLYRSETRAPLADPTKPNQYWSMDFVSDQFVHGGRFRGLTIVDIYSRESPVIEVARSMPAVRVVQVLERLKEDRGLPEAIVLDNGPEMISLALDQWACENGVKLHFIDP